MLALTVTPAMASEEAALDADLTALLAVEREGRGNESAIDAWRRVAARDAYSIPSILAAIDKANPIAANYLRSAVDAIAGRSLNDNAPLPTRDLESFFQTTDHAPRARRLAFELLAAADPGYKDRWIPKLLLDPSPELRREAVSHWQKEAESAFSAGKKEDAAPLFEKALSGAVEIDQVESLANRLKELGNPVDMANHFGLVQNWKIIGPFDNGAEKGFDVPYPPEEKVDFSATYPGKGGTVSWKDYTSVDALGKIDLNQAIEKTKGVIAYAATTFTLDQPRRVQFRLSTPNGWKLWVNDVMVFGRDEYHSGTVFDQYAYAVDLKAGDNRILVKCCQNEQTESWATDWFFQIRVCDSTGTAILALNRPEVVEEPYVPQKD
jgi:hypothetical protein